MKRTLKRALNRSGLNHTAREDELNRNADRLEEQMDKVGGSWNKDHNMSKTCQHVAGAIAAALDINRTMINWRLDADAEQAWAAVRPGLNRLAKTFSLPHIRW